MKFITKESYNRVEVKRWHERIKERYFPPECIKLTILLPCSARKPYSKSRSHKKFIKIIKEASKEKYTIVHEVILTSPLGIVPRELEEYYPASAYDIVTTGHWIHEEIKILEELLNDYIRKSRTKILGYLKDEYKKILEKYNFDIIDISEENSEKKLMKRIEEILEEYNPVSVEVREDLNIRSMLRFQFGGKILKYLNGRLSRRNRKIYINEEEIAYINNYGYIIFNINSIKYFEGYDEYFVEIRKLPNWDEIPGKYVENVDLKIRAGDCVFIKYKGRIIGTGIARISAYAMMKCKNSPVVKIKQMLKDDEQHLG